MDFLLAVLQRFFSTDFFHAAVTQGIPLLYGATGEILTEKSGNLNLGIPGIMYMGAIAGSWVHSFTKMPAQTQSRL